MQYLTLTPVVKRKRSNIVSPDAETLLQSKIIDICGHCNKNVHTAKGPQSETKQYDMCYFWVHAECEGLKRSVETNYPVNYLPCMLLSLKPVCFRSLKFS